MLALVAAPEQARTVGLGPTLRVLLFVTEGATDAASYRELVGVPPAAIGHRSELGAARP